MGIKFYQPTYENCSPVATVYRNGIMLGTNGVKSCNKEIANQLMAMSNSIAPFEELSFIEILDKIFQDTTIQKDQLIALISLGYFRKFGHNQYLLKIFELYVGVKVKNKTILPSIRNCSVIKKEKIDSYQDYGITEYIVSKYAGKETDKRFSQIDNIGLLKELTYRLEDKGMDVISQMKMELQYLGYIDYINPEVKDFYYIVTEFKTYSNSIKPYITIRRIKDGSEFKTKIKKANTFKNNPFGLYSILRIPNFTQDFKKQNIDGHWVSTDVLETVIEDYSVIK